MNGSLRQSMAWLHTWAGLLVGWILFAVFVTGTSAYFQQEITRWMQPEIRGQTPPAQVAEHAVRYLDGVAPDARSWSITLPDARSASTQVYWQPAEKTRRRRGDHSTQATLDGAGQAVAARATLGGFFLYRFHFDLHYMPVIWARWVVGFCALLMLVAILSGVITHKKIFADFFTLRLKKGQRSWLDAHNATAVLALPFHLMITYTGLVTLATLYMPWGITANYHDAGQFFESRYPRSADVARSGNPAPLADLAPMLARARTAWHGASTGYIVINNPGDATATVQLWRSSAARLASRGESMLFNGATGALVAGSPPDGGAAETESVMIGIHAGRYAGTALRWLYFLCGLAGSAMVATGLVLWTVKRRQQLPDPERPHVGFRLVEKLNIGSIAGLPIGIAGYFLANRLLPLEMPDRAAWEVHCLFMAWAAAFGWALLRPAKRAWVETLAAASVCYALVPLINALTTPRNLVASLREHDMVFAGFDLVMLALALMFAMAARRTAKFRPRVRAAAPVRATQAAK